VGREQGIDLLQAASTDQCQRTVRLLPEPQQQVHHRRWHDDIARCRGNFQERPVDIEKPGSVPGPERAVDGVVRLEYRSWIHALWPHCDSASRAKRRVPGERSMPAIGLMFTRLPHGAVEQVI
jgi:hypothetical protein